MAPKMLLSSKSLFYFNTFNDFTSRKAIKYLALNVIWHVEVPTEDQKSLFYRCDELSGAYLTFARLLRRMRGMDDCKPVDQPFRQWLATARSTFAPTFSENINCILSISRVNISVAY